MLHVTRPTGTHAACQQPYCGKAFSYIQFCHHRLRMLINSPFSLYMQNTEKRDNIIEYSSDSFTR